MFQKRLTYMVLGGLVALALVFGAFATLAQTDDDDDDATATPAAETEDGDSSETTTPGWGRHGRRGLNDGPNSELLAEALGITVEALESAQAEAREAAIEQAVAEGLLTQEQADQLLAGGFGFHKGFGGRAGFFGSAIDVDALLADALGISVEELQEARNEAYAARLDELVAAGSLTQEQADLMLAYREVEGYVDYDALNESIQAAYEAAVEQALADGVITEAQAEQMLSNIPGVGGFGFGGRGFHGRGFGGPRGGFGPFGGLAPEAPAATDSSGA